MIHGTAGIAIDIIDCGSVHLHARHFPTQKRNGETKEFLWEDPLLFNTCIAEMNELQAPKKKVSWTRFFFRHYPSIRLILARVFLFSSWWWSWTGNDADYNDNDDDDDDCYYDDGYDQDGWCWS